MTPPVTQAVSWLPVIHIIDLVFVCMLAIHTLNMENIIKLNLTL
jgi:hypothetical protein